MARKTPLRDRRAIREANRTRRQTQLWQERFAEADTPLDLLGLAYSLLRTRLVQMEAKAVARVERTKDPKAQVAAKERLVAVRADMERICGEAARFLAETAEQADRTRH